MTMVRPVGPCVKLDVPVLGPIGDGRMKRFLPTKREKVASDYLPKGNVGLLRYVVHWVQCSRKSRFQDAATSVVCHHDFFNPLHW